MAFNWNSPERQDKKGDSSESSNVVEVNNKSVTYNAEIIRIKTMADRGLRAEIDFGEVKEIDIAFLYGLVQKAIKITLR